VRTRSTEPGPPGRCRGHPGADCIKKRGSIFYGISIEFPGDATIYSVKFRWVAPRYTGGEELLGYEVPSVGRSKMWKGNQQRHWRIIAGAVDLQ